MVSRYISPDSCKFIFTHMISKDKMFRTNYFSLLKNHLISQIIVSWEIKNVKIRGNSKKVLTKKVKKNKLVIVSNG